MKKISLLLIFILALSSLSSITSLADNNVETHTVTYFTNDEYLRLNYPMGLDDCSYTSVDVEFEHGYVITRFDLPARAIYLGGREYEIGWVEGSPVGVEVTEDMAFEAYISNKPEEICHVRFWGDPMVFNNIPKDDYYGDGFLDAVIGYPAGHVFREEDLPGPPEPVPGGGYYEDYHFIWEPNPIGMTVEDGMEFEHIAVLNDTFYVTFWDSHYSHGDPEGVIEDFVVPYGGAVEPPEPPEYPDEVFIRWGSDGYKYVIRSCNIWAKYAYIGDANVDHVINSGDAAYILRYALDLFQAPNDIDNFNKLADYNCDGQVNTGDAAGVLAYAVNG